MRGPNFNSGHCTVIKFIQTFVLISPLRLDTSFSSSDYKLTTFDTDSWEMVQIQKLQNKNFHGGIIRDQNCHAHRNWIALAD